MRSTMYSALTGSASLSIHPDPEMYRRLREGDSAKFAAGLLTQLDSPHSLLQCGEHKDPDRISFCATGKSLGADRGPEVLKLTIDSEA